MLVTRDGHTPRIDATARVAAGAQIIGNLATGVLVFQGAEIGAGSRIAAGAIVHVGTLLPPRTHVGLRHLALPAASNAGFLVTADMAEARSHLAAADFFGTVFAEHTADQEQLHERMMETLVRELLGSEGTPLAT